MRIVVTTKTSRSGRIRKRPLKFADFETQDDIEDLDITVKVNQNSSKTARYVSRRCQISYCKAKEMKISI